MLRSGLFLLCLGAVVYGLSDEEISAFTARDYVNTNTGVQGTVSVRKDPFDPNVLILQSNGLPDHETGDFPSPGDPNYVKVQNNKWRIPRNPKRASATTCLPMGPIGMSINGVAFYNPYTITCCDAGAVEAEIFDQCNGHPSPNGAYHYHTNPLCNYDLVCGEPSPILGVALDGFPVYGPNDENGVQLTASDLDECNGRTDSQGNYRYHLLKEFPYFMGCYSGTVRMDVGQMMNCECTEPVDVCTEFGPPQRGTDELFECCADPAGCTRMVDGPGGAATAPASTSCLILLLAVIALFWGSRF